MNQAVTWDQHFAYVIGNDKAIYTTSSEMYPKISHCVGFGWDAIYIYYIYIYYIYM